jgi:hypothetical protein
VRALRAPDAPFAVFELGGPNIYSYREVLHLTMAQMARTRPLVGLPVALGKLGAFFAEFLPAPPITRDQVDLLTRDNIVRPGARTLADLGITPTACDVVLPTYIDRFRIRGRYSQNSPA